MRKSRRRGNACGLHVSKLRCLCRMDFSKLAGALSPIFMCLVMKKDSELPWVIRLGRWTVLAFGVLYVARCFKEWFL